MFAPDHPALAISMRGRLEKRRKELLEELILSQDWADFSRRRGLIVGIDEALRFCEDIQKEMDNVGR
jgi:hypothetical protein